MAEERAAIGIEMDLEMNELGDLRDLAPFLASVNASMHVKIEVAFDSESEEKAVMDSAFLLDAAKSVEFPKFVSNVRFLGTHPDLEGDEETTMDMEELSRRLRREQERNDFDGMNHEERASLKDIRTPELDPDQFLRKAKETVVSYHIGEVAMDEIYIVWFSKTLQNWKALLSTVADNTLYYEVTYNGDKHETYIDVYRKIHNEAIQD